MALLDLSDGDWYSASLNEDGILLVSGRASVASLTSRDPGTLSETLIGGQYDAVCPDQDNLATCRNDFCGMSRWNPVPGGPISVLGATGGICNFGEIEDSPKVRTVADDPITGVVFFGGQFEGPITVIDGSSSYAYYAANILVARPEPFSLLALEPTLGWESHPYALGVFPKRAGNLDLPPNINEEATYISTMVDLLILSRLPHTLFFACFFCSSWQNS